MSSLLIRDGVLLDPAIGRAQKGDLFIVDGKIAAPSSLEADVTIDARGRFVTPGLIDIHVHLREPGDEAKETIETGSRAAVAGGFTSVCCMPNTRPAIDSVEIIKRIRDQARCVNLCNVFPIAAITRGREGHELLDYRALREAGAIAFSDDGVGVADEAVMRDAFARIQEIDGLVSQHCEDANLSGGAMHDGVVSRELGIPGISAESEWKMIARDIEQARATGCRYHVQHISTATGVDLIRRAKRQGAANVTCEVSPHHLLLTDEACRGRDTSYKMNPPLRTAEDVRACIAGVVDGTIDCLATDHAPHLAPEKARSFEAAPFGIIGLECALPLYGKALIERGHIDWMKLIELMTTAPARIMRLENRGTLRIGAIADVTIIDPDFEWTIEARRFESKGRNCPFDQWRVRGRATHTIVGGQLKWNL